MAGLVGDLAATIVFDSLAAGCGSIPNCIHDNGDPDERVWREVNPEQRGIDGELIRDVRRGFAFSQEPLDKAADLLGNRCFVVFLGHTSVIARGVPDQDFDHYKRSAIAYLIGIAGVLASTQSSAG